MVILKLNITKDYSLHLPLAPLSLRRDQNDAIFFWKCLHRIYDLDLTKFVSFSHDNPRQNRSTESFQLNQPMFKKEASRRSFFNRIYYLWNKLPNDVRCITETSHFINNVKNVMFFNFLQNISNDSTCSWHFQCICAKCKHA